MNTHYWIWYPGDFELYHAMKQNFSRVERGMGWPAYWKSEGFRNRVIFRRTYDLQSESEFTVYSDAVGYVLAGNRKYPFGKKIRCSSGETEISIHAACIETFPAIYIEGNEIYSDGEWMAEDYDKPPVNAGYSRYFTRLDQKPSRWEYSERIYDPVNVSSVGNGVLYEFETELTAALEIRCRNGFRPLTVYCGESREEALDTVNCYYSCSPDKNTGRCPRCAVRFAYIPDCSRDELEVRAVHQFIDIPVRAEFYSSDELLNRIWNVAAHTFTLCSGVFFIDGIKRDKWIWSGDAYQSFFVNQYLMADPDINRRTLLALRGNETMTTHINTIVDYTMFWLLGVRAHYDAYSDREFVSMVRNKMTALMDFCEGQTDENGFLVGRPGDWIYIDWADLDREGPLCAEQMLFAQCMKTMAWMYGLFGENEKAEEYETRYRDLCSRIDRYFWDEEKKAYIDSYVSGKRHVTRHANIFAVLFEIADERKQGLIMEHVLRNDRVPQITTPYFKFYELDVLCRKGYLAEVLQMIREYWGGMLDRGAVTFWEEYDPEVPDDQQYDMYGDRFGKSLCHAWAASPIYLLAKYFVGLQITDGEKDEYRLEPHLEYFSFLECTLPVKDRQLNMVWDGENLTKNWFDSIEDSRIE